MSLNTALQRASTSSQAFKRDVNLITKNTNNADNKSYQKLKSSLNTDSVAQSGSLASKITRSTNQILQERLWQSNSSSQREITAQRIYQKISDFTNGDGSTNDLSRAMRDLIDSFKNLQDFPEQEEIAAIVANKANIFSNAINSFSSGLKELRNDTYTDIDDSVEDFNYSIDNIVRLNNNLLHAKKDSEESASIESAIEDEINNISKNMSIRVFQDKETGVYRVYSQSGQLLADSEVGLKLERRENRLINTVTDEDITDVVYGNDSHGGGLKSLVDTVRSETSANLTANRGIISTLENQLSLFIDQFYQNSPPNQRGLQRSPDNSQRVLYYNDAGQANPSANDFYAPARSNVLVNDPFTAYDPRQLPDQVYAPKSPPNLLINAIGRVPAEYTFFYPHERLMNFYKDLKTEVEASFNSKTGQEKIVELKNAESVRTARDIFHEYQGVIGFLPSLNINFNKSQPTDPENSTSFAVASQALAFVERMLFDSSGVIPSDVNHALVAPDFTTDNNVRVRPLQDTVKVRDDRNGVTESRLDAMIKDIADTRANYPADPTQSISNKYNAWGNEQRNLFIYMMNEVDPKSTALYGQPGFLDSETFGLSDNTLSKISERLESSYADVNTPNSDVRNVKVNSLNKGTQGMTSLEKYWENKLFVPDDTRLKGWYDLSADNIRTNASAVDQLKELRLDTDRLKNVVTLLEQEGYSHQRTSTNTDQNDATLFEITRSWAEDVSFGHRFVDLRVEREKETVGIYEEKFLGETGVNLDEEVSRLQSLQTSYAASARSLVVINEMFKTLSNIST